MATVGFIQINLYHSKGISAVLARKMAVMHTGIFLLQKPWVYRGCIRGFTACEKLFKSPIEPRPRTAIIVSS